jgi:hypothetical protein
MWQTDGHSLETAGKQPNSSFDDAGRTIFRLAQRSQPVLSGLRIDTRLRIAAHYMNGSAPEEGAAKRKH